MPRYHFNVHDGLSQPDANGCELPSLHAARCEALRRAGRTLEERPDVFRPDIDWWVDVTDERGLQLIRIDVMVSEAPVLR